MSAERDAVQAAQDVAVADASQSKSQFLAMVNHELRTPLNVVIGMTWLLEGTALTEEQRRYTARIQAAGETLMSLVEAILDYSQLRAGQVEREDVELRPNQLVEDVAERFAPSARAKGLRLYCAAEPDVPALLYGDARRIRQVLAILVDNAVKFTPQGHVSIRVASADGGGGADRSRLVFEVADSGIGLAEEDQQRVFDAFWQADASDARSYGGTGLGLALARRLAELLGGEIDVASERCGGSTFRFHVDLGVVPHTGRDHTDRERLVLLFLTEAAADVATIANASDIGDAVALKEAAHRLKGTAATFGATELARLAGLLEQRGAAGDVPAPHGSIEDLEAELDAIHTALRTTVS